MIRRTKLLIFILVFIIPFIIPFGYLRPDENFCLKIRVIDDDYKEVPCLIYLMVFTPKGFNFVEGRRSIGGVETFWISVNFLKELWEEERENNGRYALPSFAITVFTNDSKADFRIVTLKWKNLSHLFGEDIKRL